MFKIIIFILLFFSSLYCRDGWGYGEKYNANSNLVEQQIIEKVLRDGNLEPGLKPQASSMNENSIGINFSAFKISESCNSYGDLKCPSSSDSNEFFVRTNNADLKTGKVECLVYGINNIDRAMANYTYTNPTCANTWKADSANTKLTGGAALSAEQAEKDLQALSAAQTKAKDRASGVSSTFVNLSSILVAVFTMDFDIIDVEKSIKTNFISVKNGFTTFSENSSAKNGVSDISREALGSDLVSIFDFFGWVRSTIDDTVFMTVVCFLVAVLVKSGLYFRALKEDERENGLIKVVMWFITAFSGGILFLFPAGDEVVVDKDKYFSQSNYQSVIQSVFYEASKTANIVNIAVHDSLFKSQVKNRGLRSKEDIILATAENNKLIQLNQLNKNALNACNNFFDTDKLKQSIRSASFLYPLSEQELHINWTTYLPNGSISPYFALLRDQSNESVKSIGITLSQCGQFERALAEGITQVERNKLIIAGNNKIQNSGRVEFLQTRIENSYKSVEDWGFLSASLLPLTMAQLDLENFFAQALESSNPEKEQKNVAENIISNLAYLAMPGASEAKDAVANAGGKLFDSIPILSGLFATASYAAGLFVGVVWGHVLVLVLPYLIITLSALIYGVFILFDVLAYVIAGFFAILLALWTNNGEKLYAFLGRGLIIAARIISFPFTVFCAIVAYKIVHSLVGYFGNSYANAYRGDTLSLVLQLFAGFVQIIGAMAGVWLAFFIVQSLFGKILDLLGFKTSEGVGEAIKRVSDMVKSKLQK